MKKIFKKGDIVKTSRGNFGEIVEVEGYVVENLSGLVITDTYESFETCDAYRLSINKEFKTKKIPHIIKLGKNVYPMYSKNLHQLDEIYFIFKDFRDNYVILKEKQDSALLLKYFLEKSKIKYFMSDDIVEIVKYKNRKQKAR